MPTGYTADVQDGKITEFSDFALQCARAFGALITLRDDPSGTPIPEKFEPASYYRDALEKTKAEIEDLQRLTEREIEAKAVAAHEQAVAYREDRERRRLDQLARYEAMLDHARAWEPPSEEHREMKSFMIQQLEESIKFDCTPPKSSFDPEPMFAAGPEWKAQRLAELYRTLAYQEKSWREEVDRAAKRTAWVKALRESLRERALA